MGERSHAGKWGVKATGRDLTRGQSTRWADDSEKNRGASAVEGNGSAESKEDGEVSDNEMAGEQPKNPPSKEEKSMD
jgi:hypothetical protein